jgi:hypothetical protein
VAPVVVGSSPIGHPFFVSPLCRCAMNNNFDQQHDEWKETEPIQITDLDSEDFSQKSSTGKWFMVLSQTLATPRRRYSLAGLLLLILLGAIVLQFPRPTPIPPSSSLSTLDQKNAVLSPSPIRVGSEEIVPVPALLALAPTNCQLVPAPASKVFPGDWGNFTRGVTLVGQGDVWLFDGTSPLNTTSNEILHLNSQGYTSWPESQIIWEVGPNDLTPQTVVVQVVNQRTGKLAWWNPRGQQPEQTLRLAETGPNYTGEPEPGWHEWVTGLLIQQAGCYTMQVSWPGGQWLLRFAAGR